MGRVLFLAFVALLLVVAAVGGAAWIYGRDAYIRPGPPTPDGQPRIVKIDKGAAAAAIGAELQKAGAIRDASEFRLIFRATQLLADIGIYKGGAPKIRAGEFALRSGSSMKEIVEQLAAGKPILYVVVVPEGLTSAMVVDVLSQREWKANQHLPRSLKLAGPPPVAPPPEGTLLPGDYSVERGATIREVLDRMTKAQQKLLVELWPQRKPELPIQTVEDAVKLASIVENETGNAEERPLIAALFMNRLRRGMRLQSDPTIVYGISRGVPLGHGLRVSEIAAPTEWNTYQIDGLPKTPICNPGREAIKAVLNPADADWLYFVADGSGKHAFATTLKDHEKNVAAWRKAEARKSAAGSAQPPAPVAVRPLAKESVGVRGAGLAPATEPRPR